jgi:tetratricopeptide (TPR) repeat protein
LEQLAACGEVPAAHASHADWALTLTQRAGAALEGREQATWLARLETDHDNLVAALSWLEAAGDAEQGLRLAAALGRYWALRGHLVEGRARLEGLLARPDAGDAVVRSLALAAAGELAWFQGDLERAAAFLAESLDAAWREGDRSTAGRALGALALVTANRGDLVRAEELAAEALRSARDLGSGPNVADCLNLQGVVAYGRADYPFAASRFDEALTLCRDLGDRRREAMVLGNRAFVARVTRDYYVAFGEYREALTLSRDLGDLEGLAWAVEGFAALESARGDVAWAARLFGAGAAIRERIGVPVPPIVRIDHERAISHTRAGLGDARFATAWAEGRASPLRTRLPRPWHVYRRPRPRRSSTRRHSTRPTR